MEVDKVADKLADMEVGKVVDKIPDEGFTDVTEWLWRLMILMEMMSEVVMGVVDMEVDKMADMVVKIPDDAWCIWRWC